jgi:EAL domain-containing protein (putative c-di-GMP-specific phosphodiesterase class I)
MIIRTIAALGKGLQLRVVAEGVETREQAQFLKQAGIDLIQGYLHGKPARIEKWHEHFLLS